MLVFLDEKTNVPPADVEGRYRVQSGQTITLIGYVRDMRTANPQQWGWGNSQQEVQKARGDVIYLHADKLNITNR